MHSPPNFSSFSAWPGRKLFSRETLRRYCERRRDKHEEGHKDDTAWGGWEEKVDATKAQNGEAAAGYKYVHNDFPNDDDSC